ncbi:MAG: isochorismatase family cysteine hydrolase [Tistlia sp.]
MKQVAPVRNWPLTPAVTAILVIDLQRSQALPERRAAAPELAAALQGRLLPAVARLVAGARAAGCEILYTVTEALTLDGRERGLDHKLAGTLVPNGSPLAETLPETGRQEDDLLLRRTSSGVFTATNLDYLLRNLGVRNLVVAGLATDQAVDMAVRDGADLGYYLVCAADACAAGTEAQHAQSLRAFGGYCRVQTVEEILADIAAAA